MTCIYSNTSAASLSLLREIVEDAEPIKSDEQESSRTFTQWVFWVNRFISVVDDTEEENDENQFEINFDGDQIEDLEEDSDGTSLPKWNFIISMNDAFAFILFQKRYLMKMNTHFMTKEISKRWISRAVDIFFRIFFIFIAQNFFPNSNEHIHWRRVVHKSNFFRCYLIVFENKIPIFFPQIHNSFRCICKQLNGKVNYSFLNVSFNQSRLRENSACVFLIIRMIMTDDQFLWRPRSFLLKLDWIIEWMTIVPDVLIVWLREETMFARYY